MQQVFFWSRRFNHAKNQLYTKIHGDIFGQILVILFDILCIFQASNETDTYVRYRFVQN